MALGLPVGDRGAQEVLPAAAGGGVDHEARLITAAGSDLQGVGEGELLILFQQRVSHGLMVLWRRRIVNVGIIGVGGLMGSGGLDCYSGPGPTLAVRPPPMYELTCPSCRATRTFAFVRVNAVTRCPSCGHTGRISDTHFRRLPPPGSGAGGASVPGSAGGGAAGGGSAGGGAAEAEPVDAAAAEQTPAGEPDLSQDPPDADEMGGSSVIGLSGLTEIMQAEPREPDNLPRRKTPPLQEARLAQGGGKGRTGNATPAGGPPAGQTVSPRLRRMALLGIGLLALIIAVAGLLVVLLADNTRPPLKHHHPRPRKHHRPRPRNYRPRNHRTRNYRTRNDRTRNDRPRNHRTRDHGTRSCRPRNHRLRDSRPRDYRPRNFRPRDHPGHQRSPAARPLNPAMFFPIRTDRKLRRTPWVNYSLIALNVAVYAFTWQSTQQYSADSAGGYSRRKASSSPPASGSGSGLTTWATTTSASTSSSPTNSSTPAPSPRRCWASSCPCT